MLAVRLRPASTTRTRRPCRTALLTASIAIRYAATSTAACGSARSPIRVVHAGT